jgi:two-component system sensor histidine kinase RegB
MSVQGAEPMGEAARKILVADLLNEVVEQLPESQRTVVVVEVEDEGLAAVLPEQATLQSVAALLQNAIDANREQRPVIVRASGAGPELSISIRDRGHGMPESVLRRIAEPFFTTKEPGKGMGLGTFLVRTFAERLGGRLLFESADGQGTVVTLLLPLGKDAHAAV